MSVASLLLPHIPYQVNLQASFLKADIWVGWEFATSFQVSSLDTRPSPAAAEIPILERLPRIRVLRISAVIEAN